MLTVVVVSMGERASTDGLRTELSLARSSVLYADQVILMSPYAPAMGAGLTSFQTSIASETLLARLRTKRPDLYEALERAPNAKDVITGIVAKSELPSWVRGMNEISAAADRGFIAHQFSADPDTEDLLAKFVDQLFDVLADPTVHAVCDKTAASLLRHLHEAGDARVSPSLARRNREAELGAGLIARLPAFPDAPLDELLDLKKDLTEPLTRYRAAIFTLEEGLTQQVPSGELDSEIEATWRSTVAPALADLREMLTEHSFVRELARSGSASVRDMVMAGAALSIAVSSLGPIAASVSAAAGLGGAAAQVAAAAAFEHVSRRREAERADFYYLHALGEARGNPSLHGDIAKR